MPHPANLPLTPSCPLLLHSIPSRSTLLRLLFTLLTLTILFSALQTTLIRLTPPTHHPSLAPYYLFGLLHPFAPRHLALHLSRLHHSRFLSLHLLPIPVWLALILAQFSHRLRQQYPALHRALGVLTIVVSVLMLLPLVAMWWAGEKWAADAPFFLDLRRPEHVFSFKSGAWVSMVYWVVCMARLYQTAAWCTRKSHRFWVYQFLAIGLLPATMRVLTVLAVACVRWAGTGEGDPGRVMMIVAGGASFVGLVGNAAVAWGVWKAEEREKRERKME